jgi:hypothetical protein
MNVTEADLRRRQRAKNIAVACGLMGLVVLLYLITLVKMGVPS